jgi:hypothetical protein
VAYVSKRGPINLGMRMEWLFARLSFQISGAVGGRPKWKDMIRYHEPDEDTRLTDADMTPAGFAAMYGAVLKKPKE